MRFRIIGPGRAGGAFTKALTGVGWQLDRTLSRGDDPANAAEGVDLVLLCVPDGAVATVAGVIAPGDAAVVHVAGSLGLDVLSGHSRAGSVHPLMTMPDADRGAAFEVRDAERMRYHATAAVASNHLVALTAQVARLATSAGVPPAAYWPLMIASMANVAETDPATALTGPAARADWDTVRGHRSSLRQLSESDEALYMVLAAEAAALAGHQLPKDLQ